MIPIMERMPDREFEIDRRIDRHRNPEVARLKAAIERIVAAPIGGPGLPPTVEARFRQLEMILAQEPQRDAGG